MQKDLNKKYRIQRLKSSRIDNVSLSLDYWSNPKKMFPVMLFTPDMNNTDEHYHIQLTKKQARVLRDYLTSYLRSYD